MACFRQDAIEAGLCIWLVPGPANSPEAVGCELAGAGTSQIGRLRVGWPRGSQIGRRRRARSNTLQSVLKCQ